MAEAVPSLSRKHKRLVEEVIETSRSEAITFKMPDAVVVTIKSFELPLPLAILPAAYMVITSLSGKSGACQSKVKVAVLPVKSFAGLCSA